jgi:hypothetical protein
MIKEAFGELVAGWMETISQLAHGSEGWPRPQAIHVSTSSVVIFLF